MNFVDFHKALRGFTVFSLADIRQLKPEFHRRRLNEWQQKGYITKLVRGHYMFLDLALDEKALFEIANRIYAPSYVSFEMALAYHGLIPESVYGITSASTRKTSHFATAVGEFLYRTIHPRLYFGYEIVANGEKAFKMASSQPAGPTWLRSSRPRNSRRVMNSCNGSSVCGPRCICSSQAGADWSA